MPGGMIALFTSSALSRKLTLVAGTYIPAIKARNVKTVTAVSCAPVTPDFISE